MNEETLLDALAKIKKESVVCEPDRKVNLFVTDEGVEFVKRRCLEDAEFRGSVKRRAEQDPNYMQLIKLTGIWDILNSAPSARSADNE